MAKKHRIVSYFEEVCNKIVKVYKIQERVRFMYFFHVWKDTGFTSYNENATNLALEHMRDKETK